MIKKGYTDRFTEQSTGKIVYLPNTTLWRANTLSKTAIDDLIACVTAYNTANNTKYVVERAIATIFDHWRAAYGIPYASNNPAPVKS